MKSSVTSLSAESALSTRLSRLAHFGPAELEALKLAERNTRRWPAKREIFAEGEPIRQQRAILRGWACRQRVLFDGRRQIVNFLLPGDIIGLCRQSDPVALTTVLAVTEVVTCSVPTPNPNASGLSEAYAISAALEEHYLVAQITRLGQHSAVERLAGWLLETRERLALAGLSSNDELPIPLTQEFLADTLGLTSVHVNRTLRSMRQDGLIAFRAGVITLLSPSRLTDMVDYRTARVTLAA